MSTQVNCPHCATSLTIPDDRLGTTGACPSCRQVFRTPGEKPRASAPLIVVGNGSRKPALPPPIFADLDEAPLPLPLKSGEPWYYWFVAGYARIMLWLGLASTVLLGVGCPGFALVTYLASVPRGPGGGANVLLIVFLGVAWLFVFAVALLAVAFQVALVLIFVDMGRNLRTVKSQLPPAP